MIIKCYSISADHIFIHIIDQHLRSSSVSWSNSCSCSDASQPASQRSPEHDDGVHQQWTDLMIMIIYIIWPIIAILMMMIIYNTNHSQPLLETHPLFSGQWQLVEEEHHLKLMMIMVIMMIYILWWSVCLSARFCLFFF